MRLATLGINVGLSLASFVLGMALGRSPSAASNAGERELVSGAAVSAAAVSDAPVSEEALSEAPVSEAARDVSRSAPPAAAPAAGTAEASRAGKAKPPEAEPSWPQLAARAQSWTAAVRADLNYGAGLIVDRSGLFLTNLHVVVGARAITVTPFDGVPIAARVVDSDAELDLALLSSDLPSPLPSAASLGGAAALSVGDEVLAVGSPRKMYFSVSRGMVSFPQRLLEGVEYIQTDLPINEGNSGGPLVDRSGHVVGIVSFILKESQGLSFALPIDRAVARFKPYLSGKPEAPHGSGKPERATGGSPVGEPPRTSARASAARGSTH